VRDDIVHISSEDSEMSSSSALEGIKESVKNSFINKPNCKFCQCDHRSDAEGLWLQSSSISAVHRLLRSKDVEVSYAAVRNHLLSHFQKEASKRQIADYVSDLSEWRKSQIDKESRLELMLSVLEKRIFELSSVPKDSDEQFRKNSDVICKMIQQTISVQDSLDKHKGSIEPVTIFIKRLQEVIELQIEGSSNRETRRALVQVVSTLEENIGDLLSNG